VDRAKRKKCFEENCLNEVTLLMDPPNGAITEERILPEILFPFT